jgi:hypothetical protein
MGNVFTGGTVRAARRCNRHTHRALFPLLAILAAPALAQSPPPSPCATRERRIETLTRRTTE